jgi:hypothetical protein
VEELSIDNYIFLTCDGTNRVGWLNTEVGWAGLTSPPCTSTKKA